MINYTEHLTLLMQDVVARVPTLSFIDMADVLVFGRFGRSEADGPFATCHCLSMPASDPGYYFWRDRGTGQITRRSEWFVTKSPTVTLGSHPVKYLISFTLPRFCDQSLGRSRKERFYRRSTDAWVAKLDTVIHELYHIDPEQKGIRRIERENGTCSAHSHGPQFLAQVAQMVSAYLDTSPHPSTYDFLKHDFDELEAVHGGVVGTSFSPFPSYPQRFQERMANQPPCSVDLTAVDVDQWREPAPRACYTEHDLHVRQFLRRSSRKCALPKRETRAA